MSRSNADLLALKAELTNDPKHLGLTAPPAIDDVGNADKLNAVSAATQIDRESIPLSEVMLNIDRDEFVALGPADRQWLLGVGQGGSINPKQGGEVYEGILQLFGPNTESRANLVGILKENASRINQMFKQGLLQVGGLVTPSDVAAARNAS